ncbi:MAG: hypothetical protein HZB43_11295 [candidate division Zixibacteria bacterium]|nr:hypothetical protein [candidate division Zixibacteria bacterium]
MQYAPTHVARLAHSSALAPLKAYPQKREEPAQLSGLFSYEKHRNFYAANAHFITHSSLATNFARPFRVSITFI